MQADDVRLPVEQHGNAWEVANFFENGKEDKEEQDVRNSDGECDC